MTVKFTNNANSTLASGINSSVTSMTVADASSFPSLSGANDYCYLTLQESGGTTREIVKATARSSNTFTIVRGQDNTSAATWSSGILVELRITSALLQDVIDGLGSGSMMDTDIFTGDGSDTTFTLSRQPDNENNLLVFVDGVFQAHNAYSVSGTTLTFSAAPANSRVITAYHMATTVGGSNLIKATMTGDNSDTTLDVGSQIIHENNVQVYFDGVYQSKGNYSVSGSVITFSTAPPTGVAVEAILNTATNISTATQLADADSDTLIQVEESSDEDTIRMDIAGTEVLTLTNSAMTLKGTTPTLTIGDAGAEDTKIVFDGNAQDFYIGLDDSADDLIIGLGSAVGTTPIISVDENKDVAIPDGNLTITESSSFGNGLILKNTSNTHGSILLFKNDSSSPADGDYVGSILFNGNDSAGNDTSFAKIFGRALDVTDGTEDGEVLMELTVAGSSAEVVRFNSSEAVFNDSSQDIDFRVESDNDTHALFVQGSNGAVGIGVSDPGGLPLHLKVASGDCKLRMETANKDAFVMELDNSTGALHLGSAGVANAIVIEQDGQVGIGTALPGGALQIDADSGSEDLFVLNNEKSGSDQGVVTQFRREGTGTGFISNSSSSTVYSTSQSDKRAKKNFEDWAENVLPYFKDLKPTKFHFTQEDDSSEKNKGYIAQDLVDNFPEAYPLKNDGEDAGRYFFNPGGMVVYLMKAIQEQQALIETLQTKVKALEEA